MPIFQKTKRYRVSPKCDAEGKLWRLNLGAQFGCFVRKKLISTTPPGQFLCRPAPCKHSHI